MTDAQQRQQQLERQRRYRGRTQSRDVAGLIVKAAMNATWSARNPRETFSRKPETHKTDRFYYQTEDGWNLPVWRVPPLPGSDGAAVALCHSVGWNHLTFDFDSTKSLAGALHRSGFDVYMVGLRGDRESIPPTSPGGFDFDDMAAYDVPAAIDFIKNKSGCSKLLWVGHAMGGQLLYAHLAHAGVKNLAGAVSLCAPVRFARPRSHARLVSLASRVLPTEWAIPHRFIQQVLAPLGESDSGTWTQGSIDGPTLRGLMLHGVEDIHAGVVKQVARWATTGSLCDRNDRLDYVAAIAGLRLPIFGVAAQGDPICPPEAAFPAIQALGGGDHKWLELGPEWGHLDPIVGTQASETLFPTLVDWLNQQRTNCWAE